MHYLYIFPKNLGKFSKKTYKHHKVKQGNEKSYAKVMKNSGLQAVWFNTHRMAIEQCEKCYGGIQAFI